MKYRILYQECLQKKTTIQYAYKENLTLQYMNWKLSIDTLKNIQLTNVLKNRKHLFDLLEGHKIILYYDNKMCKPCVNKEFDNLSKLANNIGYSNILIIAQTPLFDLCVDSCFKKNIWSCNECIFDIDTPIETPVMLVTLDTKILAVCCANKMTNHIYKYFSLFIENITNFNNKNKPYAVK